MSWKGTRAFALISMTLMFGLALVWILSGALKPASQPPSTGGGSFVAGGVRVVPLIVALAVAIVIAFAELLLRRKKR